MFTKAKPPHSTVFSSSIKHASVDKERMPLLQAHCKAMAISINQSASPAFSPLQNEKVGDTDVINFVSIGLASGLMTSVVGLSVGFSLSTALASSLLIGSFVGIAALLMSESEDFLYTDNGSETESIDDIESVLSDPPKKENPVQLEMAVLPGTSRVQPAIAMPSLALTAAIQHYESLLETGKLKYAVVVKSLSSISCDPHVEVKQFILDFAWDDAVVFQEEYVSSEISKSTGAIVITEALITLKEHCVNILPALNRNHYLYGKMEELVKNLTQILREYAVYTNNKAKFYIL